MDHLIPDDIIKLCASFYLGREYFACHGQSYSVDEDRTTITKIKGRRPRKKSLRNISKKRTNSYMDGDLESAFGHIAVPSMSGKVHCWTFKVEFVVHDEVSSPW